MIFKNYRLSSRKNSRFYPSNHTVQPAPIPTMSKETQPNGNTGQQAVGPAQLDTHIDVAATCSEPAIGEKTNETTEETTEDTKPFKKPGKKSFKNKYLILKVCNCRFL